MTGMAFATGTSKFHIPMVLSSPVKCAECANRLCSGVVDLPGVLSADCSPRTSEMTVTFDTSAIAVEELERRVLDLGLDVTGAVEHATYRVTGLD